MPLSEVKSSNVASNDHNVFRDKECFIASAGCQKNPQGSSMADGNDEPSACAVYKPRSLFLSNFCHFPNAEPATHATGDTPGTACAGMPSMDLNRQTSKEWPIGATPRPVCLFNWSYLISNEDGQVSPDASSPGEARPHEIHPRRQEGARGSAPVLQKHFPREFKFLRNSMSHQEDPMRGRTQDGLMRVAPPGTPIEQTGPKNERCPPHRLERPGEDEDRCRRPGPLGLPDEEARPHPPGPQGLSDEGARPSTCLPCCQGRPGEGACLPFRLERSGESAMRPAGPI